MDARVRLAQRDKEYRLSLRRRMARFERFMRQHYGAEWFRSINEATVNVEDKRSDALAQASGTGDYYEALRQLGLPATDRSLQHAALLPYNLRGDKIAERYKRREVQHINAAVVALVLERKAAHRNASAKSG